MRIVPFIILLFASVGAMAQNIGSESGRSINVEPYRSHILPSSSAEEAAGDKSGAMRFAIPVADWAEQREGSAVNFSSSFATPFSWIGRQSIISIESASAPYSVWIGGREVGSCFTPSMPAQFNISRYIEDEVDTPIVISMQRSSSISQLEAWSSAADGFELGHVVMLSQPTMYIRDVDVRTDLVSGSLNSLISVAVKSEALNPRTSRINYELLTPQGEVAKRGHMDLNLDMRREDTIHIFAVIPDTLAWSVENPNLYRLNLSTQYRGRYIEYHSYEIGMRSIEHSRDGELIINGLPQPLKVVEVTSAASVLQLSELKSAGYNAVKIAAGGYNREIYNYADSAGLYIVATAPINTSHSGGAILRGGNPTNDPDRVNEYIERVDAIYNVTKLHPSVIAFAIADTSLNGINLYESYLYLKSRERQRPVVYLQSGGEWNSDKLVMEF
ncbi:MAG: glycoside hydrolase family 2 TIM barrel-domain containing protein [Rikenellaceae bacterium]